MVRFYLRREFIDEKISNLVIILPMKFALLNLENTDSLMKIYKIK